MAKIITTMTIIIIIIINWVNIITITMVHKLRSLDPQQNSKILLEEEVFGYLEKLTNPNRRMS